jgi:hypothetical protein
MDSLKPSRNNMYYPVFRNIESEIIELSQGIYFSDEQISVYSIKISELLSRCLTEIESLYKDLYRRENNSDPMSIGDAWRFLDSAWQLSKKELTVTSDNFFFDRSFHPYFAPFDYGNGSMDDFYASYNAIKHDRAKNLPKANLNVLIRALGALYILNVYYSNEVLMSSVFDAKTAGRAAGVFIDMGLDLADFMDTCLFIEYFEYDYYLWQVEHYNECSKTLSELTQSDKDNLKMKIVDYSSNVSYIMNILYELHDPNLSIGDMLKASYPVSKPLADGEVIDVVNTGYSRVYLNVSELEKKISEISNDVKIVAHESLKSTAIDNM